MATQPSGTVTFLFTDIEGSTRLWEQHRDAMPAALMRHDAIVRDEVESAGGVVVKSTGDGTLAVFERPGDAIVATAAIQRAITAQDWIGTGPLRVRMGLHTGIADERAGDYFGPALNRTARLMAIGHGEQVLISSTTATLVEDTLPAGTTLRELGEHRLRDLSRPERVFQVVAPGLRETFPPLRSLDALPTNLPVQLTSFVGRDEEVKSVAGLLADHRVVTITGVGGVGKTRLALHVAAEVLADFRDGAWVAELAAVADADAMAEVIAAGLRVRRHADASVAESIVEALRTKELLLVLDNCEHLIGEVADLVEDLVERCPGVHVLATSREGLGVDGERVWPLRSLRMPARTDGTEAIASSDAALLLVDRARAVLPDFALDDASAKSVAEICRRLDGIPLAIELAAARLAAMQPREIAEHLDERFRLLTGGRRRGVERHQTLRATVDWSYSLLGTRDRTVFDRLGVFAGSFDASAAEAVVADDDIDRFDVLDALNELVAKSMVGAEPSSEGSTRYQLLETLRQYALEQLDAEAASDASRRRHAEYYARFAEGAAPQLLGPHELTWRPRVLAEIDDLRAAVSWALDRDHPDDAELAMRIIGALAIESVGNRRAGIGNWAERAITSPATARSPHRAAVYGAAAYGAFHRLDARAAAEYGEIAANAADSPTTFTFAEAIRANLALNRRDFVEAARINLAALDRLGDSREELGARLLLCPTVVFLTISGDIDAAMDLADRMLADARRLGQPSGLALVLYVRGFVYGQRDSEVAARALEESIALTRAGASDVVFAHALNTLGVQRLTEGDVVTAISLMREAAAHSYDAGDGISIMASAVNALSVFAEVGLDVAAATCAGALLAGVFAEWGSSYDSGGGQRDLVLAEVRGRLGAERYDTAYAQGAVADYDDLVALILATFDEALSLV